MSKIEQIKRQEFDGITRRDALRIGVFTAFGLAASGIRLAAAEKSGSIYEILAFGGKPYLKSTDGLRKDFAPYSIVKVNYLGMNYNENLLDIRNNITSYTHMGFDSNKSDAWHLHFPDDAARFLEGIAWESEFSPVARIDLARRIAKGLLSAHVPGTKAYYYFRQRSGGKSELIFDAKNLESEGMMTLSSWGDDISGEVKIGFRAKFGEKWFDMKQFQFQDTPEGGGSPEEARTEINWNKSPYLFQRDFTMDGRLVEFTGKYWMSDEDMPLQYEFNSKDADKLEIVVGEPEKPAPILAMGDANMPGVIYLPDRTTAYQSDKTGDKEFLNPNFNYIILSKNNSWAAPGYASAILIMWEGRPDRITAIAKNGYGEIRISYAEKKGRTGGKVWLYPFPILNQDDMQYIYRNAESFLANGKLLSNSFPPLQMLNAIPTGLAAAAYILTKYNDPVAPTVRANALNAVDEVFEAERIGKKFVRVFFPVRAAAWLIKTGKELGDREMVDKYTSCLAIVMKRMLSSSVGYDGKGWPGGWDHFNSTKACWLAYDATGDPECKSAFDRALTVYTIDSNGIYRYGSRIPDPGGINTYFGSMPMGVWGVAGKMDWANRLLNLNVPAEPGWKNTAKDFWHDAGNGPWSQDDANPEYAGLSLRGLNISQRKKFMIPVGAFPIYEVSGDVSVTKRPIVDNQFFLPGKTPVKIVDGVNINLHHNIIVSQFHPGDVQELLHLKHRSGLITRHSRVCRGVDKPLIYQFDASKAIGAALDMHIKGDGFTVEASPDGRRWYQRLDTWSGEMKTQSLDLSFLTGSKDEFVKTLLITPGRDRSYLADAADSKLMDSNCRYAGKERGFIYKLDLPHVTECYLELFIGNGYKIEISEDGRGWSQVMDASGIKTDTGAVWIRMLDVTGYITDTHTLFVRISNMDKFSKFSKSAFLRRLTVYSVMKTDTIQVRISNVYNTPDKSFTLDKISFRKWMD